MQNAFEQFSLTFGTPEIAHNWYSLLTEKLSVLLERALGSRCEVCFGRLRPAYCCHCVKCDRICCENCCAYINSHDRKTASKNMVCLSCLSYNNEVLKDNTDVDVLIKSRNSGNQRDFIQPLFVCNMETKSQLNLLEGWEACMLSDSRVYYFNRNMWLSSWCVPKEGFRNDTPYGWQKYYGEKGSPFYYNVKTKKVSETLPYVDEVVMAGCPACSYELSQNDMESGKCPSCNTCVKEKYWFCLFPKTKRESLLA